MNNIYENINIFTVTSDQFCILAEYIFGNTLF